MYIKIATLTANLYTSPPIRPSDHSTVSQKGSNHRLKPFYLVAPPRIELGSKV